MKKAGGKKAPGVHLILGPDSFLAEQALATVLASWLGEEDAEVPETLQGDEATWVQVLDAARTGSLFSARRAVVVRGADRLSGDPDGLEAYLDSPTPGLALVLMAGKVDRRRVVWKQLVGRAQVRSCEPLKGRALRARLSDELSTRRLRIAPDGVQELLDRVGPDLRRLMGEIDKLEAYGDDEVLSADTVAAVLGRGIARPLYRLADAFVERRTAQTLELLAEILEEGESSMLVLGALHRALRQVRGATALGQAGRPAEEAVSRLGILPFKVDAVMRAARGWTEHSARRATLALGRADRRLKRGSDARVALTTAVVEALGGRPPARTGLGSGR